MTEKSEDESFNQLPEPGQAQARAENNELSRHLESEEIERLLNGSLRGERLVAVLVHLEDCNHCQQKLPPVEAETLLKAVFEDGELPDGSHCSPLKTVP